MHITILPDHVSFAVISRFHEQMREREKVPMIHLTGEIIKERINALPLLSFVAEMKEIISVDSFIISTLFFAE